MEEQGRTINRDNILKNFFKSAIRNNRKDILEKVLEEGLDPSIDNNWGLIACAKNGNLELLKILLQDNRVDGKYENNFAMNMAIRYGNRNIIEYLLDTLKYSEAEILEMNTIANFYKNEEYDFTSYF